MLTSSEDQKSNECKNVRTIQNYNKTFKIQTNSPENRAIKINVKNIIQTRHWKHCQQYLTHFFIMNYLHRSYRYQLCSQSQSVYVKICKVCIKRKKPIRQFWSVASSILYTTTTCLQITIFLHWDNLRRVQVYIFFICSPAFLAFLRNETDIYIHDFMFLFLMGLLFSEQWEYAGGHYILFKNKWSDLFIVTLNW